MQYRLAEKKYICHSNQLAAEKHSICKAVVLSGFPGNFYTFVHNKEADNDGINYYIAPITLL
jgi:hypothetical protein